MSKQGDIKFISFLINMFFAGISHNINTIGWNI